jgi:hypothetical protein
LKSFLVFYREKPVAKKSLMKTWLYTATTIYWKITGFISKPDSHKTTFFNG